MSCSQNLKAGLTGSAIFRACVWVRSHASEIYRNSVIGRAAASVSRAYPDSRVKRVWDGFLVRESGAETSFYGRFFHALHTLCHKFGAWFMPLLLTSFLYRAIDAVKGFFRKVFFGSVIYRAWTAAGMDFRRLLILGFSLYLPIDWVLRDVLSLNTLASVWDELFFLFAAAYVIWLRVSEREWDGRTRVSRMDMPILLFSALGFFLMCVNCPVPSIALAGLRATIQYLFWFFVIIRLIRNDGDIATLCAGIAFVGLAMALHGIYQYIVAVPIPASWMTKTEESVRTRAFSITGSPNILGTYMVLTAPLFAAFSYYVKRPFFKVCAWGCVGLEMICLLVTYSKGAWVGMVCAVLMFSILHDRRILGLLSVGVAGALTLPSILNRILYLFTPEFSTASAAGGRSMRWKRGMSLLNANKLLGFGLGRFGGAVAMQNQYLEVTSGFSYFYLDNYYLKIAVEMGYPGVILFIIMMLCLLVQGIRVVGLSLRTKLSPLASGILSGLFGVMMHCIFENIFEEPYMMALFWGLAAALMAIPKIQKSEA